MSHQQRIIQTDALPPNIIKPFPQGSNSIYSAGIVTQNNQAQIQNILSGTNKLGGKKRYKGGATPPLVQVPQSPSYDPNKGTTNMNNQSIYELAISSKNNAAFDGTVGAGPSATAQIATQQQTLYNGTIRGGTKFKLHKYKKKTYRKRRSKKHKSKKRNTRKRYRSL